MAYLQREIGEKKMTDGIDAGTLALLSGGKQDGLGMGGGLIGGLLLGGLLGGNRGGGLFGNGCGNGYGSPTASAVATDIVLNPAFQSLENQISGLSSQVTNNGILDAISDLTAASMAGVGSVTDNINGVTRDILAGQSQLSANLAQSNYTTLTSINALDRDVTAQANQNALQQLNSFNQLNTATLQGFNESSRDTSNITNMIVSGQNAAAAAMAACCCDIKSTIKDSASATDALINAINLQNIQAQLCDAKSQISDMQQTNILKDNNAAQTMTILQHLVPYMAPQVA